MTTANLASNLVETASGLGDSVALRVGPTATTYAELDWASSRVAGMLRERGLKPGDPVGIMLPNVAEFAVIYYGVLRAGCAVVPMNPLLKAREVAYYLGDSGARLMFAWHAFAGDAQAGAQQAAAEAVVVDPATFPGLVASATPEDLLADRDADDIAVILYTSGTTGSPKGAEVTHANLARNAEVVPRFAPDQALQIIAEHRVTIFEGVPTMPVEVLRSFEEAFGCPVLEGYGLSETSPVASFNHPRKVWIVNELPKGPTGDNR